MSVWSTYFQLAGRLSRRIKEATGAVVIWGGIHPQTRPADCLEHADIACQSEGEYVLAELTDRIESGSRLRGSARLLGEGRTARWCATRRAR